MLVYAEFRKDGMTRHAISIAVPFTEMNLGPNLRLIISLFVREEKIAAMPVHVNLDNFLDGIQKKARKFR